MEKTNHIVIVCGEPSGDLHAANLCKNLKILKPNLRISGVGGKLFKQVADFLDFDIAGLSVMGFFDVLTKLPQFFTLKRLLLKKIAAEKPDAIILVDFSGFNLRLAKALHNQIPVIYYISPQVWASREGRIETIRRYVKKMIVLFKFEEEFYKKHGIDVDFVGHPLLDIINIQSSKKDFFLRYQLLDEKPTIALLPGSRISEIKNILPTMLSAAHCLTKTLPDAQFILASTSSVPEEIYRQIINKSRIQPALIQNQTYECLAFADTAMVCSGTATLEAAIIGNPFLVAYKTQVLTYLLYKPQIRVAFISIVNLIAGKEIVAEFVQFKATPKNLAKTTNTLISDQTAALNARKNLKSVVSQLGQPGASRRAAEKIIQFIYPA